MTFHKSELMEHALELHLEPLPRKSTKEQWAAYIEENLPKRYSLLLWMLTEQMAEALDWAVDRNAEMDLDTILSVPACAALLNRLGNFGLAEEQNEIWTLAPEVKEFRDQTLPEREILGYLDFLDDLMTGWLMHVGMMPVKTLVDRIADVLKDGEVGEEQKDDFENTILPLRMIRHGASSIQWYEDGPWMLDDELEAPELLMERITSPAWKDKPYPSYSAEELLHCCRETQLPGPDKIYEPLKQAMKAAGYNEGQILDCITWLWIDVNDSEETDVLGGFLEEAKPSTRALMEHLSRLALTLINHIPQWSNKGYSACQARDLFTSEPKPLLMTGGIKISRNDPCPCGSGKKYKKCCGQNVH